MSEEAFPDEPSEEDIKGIAEIFPDSSPEEVLRIAKSIHERWKKIHEDELKRKELIQKVAKSFSGVLLYPASLCMIEAAHKREADIMAYGEEVWNDAVLLSQSSEHDIETCLEICINKNLRGLEADIDKQPVINLNDVYRRTRSKEGRLPRKLRAGWK